MVTQKIQTMKKYYNTTNLSGSDLDKATKGCESQDDKILAYFRQYPHDYFTPFQVLSALFLCNCVPITSVRRSISNLTDAGLLEKTDVKRTEIYGKANYCWKLAKREPKQLTLLLL